MSKRKIAPKTNEQYSPDLKLRIVLEYIRAPKRRKRICQENQITEELLGQWYQEFLD